MPQPFRTHATWLSDDQLVLLDVLFDCRTSFRLLRQESFREQWNLGYSHSLYDGELTANLRWLCEHGVLITEFRDGETLFWMTPAGGQLWTRERCPIWERYCTEQYNTTLRGRTLMRVVAVSRDVRDDFLAIWPESPARHRTATVVDTGLIEWRPFGKLFVGFALYDEKHTGDSHEEYLAWSRQNRDHWKQLEERRTWWRSVPELQRFLPGARSGVQST